MIPLRIEQAMQAARMHQQMGHAGEAEGVYRRILAEFPDHAPALHGLGVLAGQTGRVEWAIELIGRAIAHDRGVAEYHSNLGEFHFRSGHWEEAAACLRRALALKPTLAVAQGNLANALGAQGLHEEAIAAYRRTLVLKGDDADVHCNLGVVLQECGRLDEAIAAYRRAIELKPRLAAAYYNLGTTLRRLKGRSAEAVTAFGYATQLMPEHAPAYNNLACALQEAGQLEDAIPAYLRAIALDPSSPAARSNLGSAWTAMGRLDEALTVLRRAIELDARHAEAHSNLGVALHAQGDCAGAIAAYRRALELKPDSVLTLTNLGNAYHDAGQPDEAIAALRKAIKIQPDHAEAHNTLGNVVKDHGRIDQALACFRTALEYQPDHAAAASNLLFTAHFHPNHDAEMILAEHRRWAAQFAAPLAAHIPAHSNDRTPDRKLRVGFVSADLRMHPVGRFVRPLFAHRDREQTELLVYSDVRTGDAVTGALRSLADGWRCIAGMSDGHVADWIKNDAIDVLVDLSAHTAGNRLLVFARKPAPVQVTMLGLPTTTGLATIDYRITDPYLDPPGHGDEYAPYTERSVRLPHCLWCYQPASDAPAVAPLPALKKGHITFGCLNQFGKMSLPTLNAFVNIMQSLEHSRLVLHAPPGRRVKTIRAVFAGAGIAPGRVEFVARVPFVKYLERYNEIDLCLDPFPYSGGTTTLDALWMGVPVITLAGQTAVGRGGVSILSNLGLTELIARTPGEYVGIAARWSKHPALLSELRAGLRRRMEASPLLDGRQYAADVEGAIRKMWIHWCGR